MHVLSTISSLMHVDYLLLVTSLYTYLSLHFHLHVAMLNINCMSVACLFFFFQAEDGIRDKLATGVQTCALPISCDHRVRGFPFCQDCIVAGVELLRQQSTVNPAYILRRKSSPFIATLLSFVPGLGAAYNGQTDRKSVV